ncbi:glutathionylspermidine synthase family protein [Cellulophaga baltica]|uniref:glutathionylspermidine synthase family protein n=1 Tax=Cellulophaga baltica TaxID=76594 RepID=UPI0024946A15|nr:glutathionylspermidine synthase family protein [Cellulophaga baltica]
MENRLDRLEDSRFKEIKRLKKKDVSHHLLWYLKQDYFSEELLGLHNFEIENFKKLSAGAYALYEKATEKILRENQLGLLDIPDFFHDCINHSWKNRTKHPFLYGRFDINGGIKQRDSSVIEFNADTCSTLPETIHWQSLQNKELKGNNTMQFNNLATDIAQTLRHLKTTIDHPNPFILGSSFGYEEDVLNVNSILDIAHEEGYKTFYTNLEEVTFSQENGILYEINGEYQIVDVWFKMIPWDWMFNEEPQLAKDLSGIILKDLCTVLNPPYTAIWQNKKFMAYITTHFPNHYIAQTLTETPYYNDYVTKPVYGRLGENIEIKGTLNTKSKGDYANQDVVYQKYYPLERDLENYYYQAGIFFTNQPSALNLRSEENAIISDDCEFMSHYII